MYREDICLQTLLLLFKFAKHRNKRPFVSTANEALAGTLMTIGDVNDIFPILGMSASHNHEYAHSRHIEIRVCTKTSDIFCILSNDLPTGHCYPAFEQSGPGTQFLVLEGIRLSLQSYA